MPNTLAHDCARCRNEICADRESCQRWISKDNLGQKTPTIMWANWPKNKEECGVFYPQEMA